MAFGKRNAKKPLSWVSRFLKRPAEATATVHDYDGYDRELDDLERSGGMTVLEDDVSANDDDTLPSGNGGASGSGGATGGGAYGSVNVAAFRAELMKATTQAARAAVLNSSKSGKKGKKK